MLNLVTRKSVLSEERDRLNQMSKTQRTTYEQYRNSYIRELEISEKRRENENARYKKKIASLKSELAALEQALADHGIPKDGDKSVEENNSINEGSVDLRKC